MPENPIERMTDSIQDRLADLGERFNTNKEFGLMGYLANQQEQQPQPQAPADPVDTGDSAKPPEWFESVNSSLRAISDKTEQQFGQLRNELSTLRQPVAQQPNMEDFGVMDDPVAQKLSGIETTLAHTRLNTAYERARNSLNAAKQRYGNDFDYKEQDLQSVWQQHIGNNVQAAESTNWDIYFQQQHDSRRAPKLEQRIKELETSLSKGGRDVLADMGAAPRGNRTGAPKPSGSVGNNEFDEDVYRRASSRMGKGKFMGFNRLLVEEQNKKLLRTAG